MDRVWAVFLEGLIPMTASILVLASVLLLIRTRAGRPLRDVVFVSALDALLVGWLVGLLLVTLGNLFGEGRQLDLVPFRSISRFLSHWNESTAPATQLVGNVLLFLPGGLLAPARIPRLRAPLATLAAAGLLAVTIETLQFLSAQGRVASTDDVILAIVGAGVGWLLFRALTAMATARTRWRASLGSPRS